MCTDELNYEYFPARTIGGPSGDYSLQCDVTSAQWAEFRVCSIAQGDAGPGAFIISSNGPPLALKWDGTVTINQDTEIKGLVFRLASTSSQVVEGAWYRVVHSQKKVFVRIDVPNTTSGYITLQFRTRVLKIIPGPSHTVHPDHEQQLNMARAEKTEERLKKMGITLEREYGNAQ